MVDNKEKELELVNRSKTEASSNSLNGSFIKDLEANTKSFTPDFLNTKLIDTKTNHYSTSPKG